MKPTKFLEHLTDAALVVVILALYVLVSTLDAPEFDQIPAVTDAAVAASEPLTVADWELAK